MEKYKYHTDCQLTNKKNKIETTSEGWHHRNRKQNNNQFLFLFLKEGNSTTTMTKAEF
jgi:hypothetical protein